jgi:hypothetical protein
MPNASIRRFPTPTCRWGKVEGPRRAGRPTSSVVWICEHPYRTMRATPDPECEGCRRASRERERDRTVRLTAVATRQARMTSAYRDTVTRHFESELPPAS